MSKTLLLIGLKKIVKKVFQIKKRSASIDCVTIDNQEIIPSVKSKLLNS
jgi:hypothetical protein